MKKVISSLFIGLISLSLSAFTAEVNTVTLSDGEEVAVRLCLPDNEVETIVFCIHGTGPSTYDNKRATFSYYDELANGFCAQGLAFSTYNRRGCTTGNTPPLFVDVDSIGYAKYTPMQEAEDVEVMITSLLNDQRFKHCKIILYGLSEGTVIAPIVAERGNVNIDALLLHGYTHDNMYDVVKWQNEGHGIMLMVCSIFDQDGDKAISKEEYESTNERAIDYPTYADSLLYSVVPCSLSAQWLGASPNTPR